MLRLKFWNAVVDVLVWLDPLIDRWYVAALGRQNAAMLGVLHGTRSIFARLAAVWRRLRGRG